MAEEQVECPHCDEPYYPLWVEEPITTRSPSRSSKNHLIGHIWTTTCTRCDEPIIEFKDGNERDAFKRVIRKGSQQIYPTDPEVVIKIIVQVFIDFENLQRRHGGAEEMTEEEETAWSAPIRRFFQDVFETVKTGGNAAPTLVKYLPFFNTLLQITKDGGE